MRATVFRRPIALAVLAAALPALAVENPYLDTITSRNLFALQPIPPPAAPPSEVKPPEPPQKVLLTGITTLMGGRHALLRVQRPARPPEPAREIPLILAEGGPAEEEVQVRHIDVAAGTVGVLNRGVPQTLDITKDSPAPRVAAAPGSGISIPPPPALVAGPGGARGIARGVVVPGRPLRGVEMPRAAGSPSLGGQITAPDGSPGGAPAGWVGGNLGRAGGAPAAPSISPEEQIILIEAQRAAGIPEAPILPPTALQDIIHQENLPNPQASPPPIPHF